jgi:uncharacterized membrane protein YtjA (UPF0391 family)
MRDLSIAFTQVRLQDGRVTRAFPTTSATARSSAVLKWAIIFAIISLLTGWLGFSGLSGFTAMIAKILFFIFLILLVLAILAVIGILHLF